MTKPGTKDINDSHDDFSAGKVRINKVDDIYKNIGIASFNRRISASIELGFVVASVGIDINVIGNSSVIGLSCGVGR